MKKNSSTVNLRERVKSPPSQSLVDAYYEPSVTSAIRYQFSHEMRIHLAHSLMLEKCKIVPKKDILKIINAILKLQKNGPSELEINYKQEDLYSYVETYLIKILGTDIGGKLHTARSRNDLNITSWRLALRDELIFLLNRLNDFRETIINSSELYSETIMPGYTHSQHAQPITFGYYLLSLYDIITRDYLRIKAALKNTNCSPLGAGALCTTGFNIDRELTKKLLGFDALLEIAYDGVSSRDDLHEAVSSLTILMTNLSRFAFDLQSWNTMEFGMIELADEFSSVSSIMPQKKNPQALEYVKSATGYVTGALITVLSCSKNTSLSDVNDGVTAINVPAMEACKRTYNSLSVLTGVVKTLKINSTRMKYLAEIGFGSATELADVIVRESGISFRLAHNIVGLVVREAILKNKTALSITASDINNAALLLFNKKIKIEKKVIQNALNPEKNIKLRKVVGGPANVKTMAIKRKKFLHSDIKENNKLEKKIEESNKNLQLLSINILKK